MEGDGIQKDALRAFFPRPRRSFGLRMAPLIDLVFLLLIFFLVAVKWRPQEDFIPLRLPTAQAQGPGVGRPEPLRIYISSIETGCLVRIGLPPPRVFLSKTRAGRDAEAGQGQTVQINTQTMEGDLAELMEKIEEVLAAQKRLTSDPIEIICEPDVKSEFWVRVCNVFYGMRMTDITFPMTQWQEPDE